MPRNAQRHPNTMPTTCGVWLRPQSESVVRDTQGHHRVLQSLSVKPGHRIVGSMPTFPNIHVGLIEHKTLA